MLTGPIYTVTPSRDPILDPGRLDPLIVATSAVLARKLRIRLDPGSSRARGFTMPVWMVIGPPDCACPVCEAAGDEAVYSIDERFEPLTEERQ